MTTSVPELVEVELFDRVILVPQHADEFAEVELTGQTVIRQVTREQWVEVSEQGPQGIPGVPGSNGGDTITFEHHQTVASASWIIPVPVGFGRTPSVTVYVGGKLVLTDVDADATTVNIHFPDPTVGSAVLS